MTGPLDVGATVDNHGLFTNGTGLAAERLELADDIHTLGNFTEDNVLAVKPAGLGNSDEELGAVPTSRGNQQGPLETVTQTIGQKKEDTRGTYVLGPALAIDRRPGLSWVLLKFSSANFSP
jgi:hypothetical protein